MTAKAIVRKGDVTSHGGKVIEGWDEFEVYGVPVAGKGHMVICPKCKGTFPIVGGASSHSWARLGTALDGMKTACGATLTASQSLATVDSGSVGTIEHSPLTNEQALVERTDNAPFDQHFLLINSRTGKQLTGRHYSIRMPNGEIIRGQTDESGMSNICTGVQADQIELIVYDDLAPINPDWDR